MHSKRGKSATRSIYILLSSLLFSSCTITEPVVVVGSGGEVLRGMTEAALTGGSFGVTDGKLTCNGTYNDWDLSPTITASAKCTDGRTGTITATREADGLAGMGSIAVSDGSIWSFGFGRDTTIIEQKANTRVVQAVPQQPPPQAPPQNVVAPPSEVVADSYSTSGSHHSIQMTRDGGTYIIPVTINQAIKLDFVVDSGAADVTIPADVVLTLFRTGTVNKNDFLGNKTYQLADGSTLPSPTFRIKSLTIGDITVSNVTAGLAPVQGSLLLGQSFLSRFKSWSMDNKQHALVLEGDPTPK